MKKRSNLYTVTVDFFLIPSGKHYLRRKIGETGLTKESAANKIRRRYSNKSKYGSMKIVSITSYYGEK